MYTRLSLSNYLIIITEFFSSLPETRIFCGVKYLSTAIPCNDLHRQQVIFYIEIKLISIIEVTTRYKELFSS